MSISGRNILQVLPELSTGGVERTTVEITEALLLAGATPHVVSAGGRLEGEIVDMGARVYRLPLAAKGLLQIQRNRKSLIELIKKQKIDLVHARSRAPAWSALGACKATGTPFVTTYHGIYSGASWPKVYYNSVMARGDIVIANSQFTARRIQSKHGTAVEKITTIPRGVDMTIFSPSQIDNERLEEIRAQLAIKPNKMIFILPARLTRWKGQTHTIKAMSQLPPSALSKVQCILAGDAQGRSGYEAELKSLIKQHGLDGIVTLAPHITDMPAALMAADWVLAPSLREEAFGRLAAEAGAMGKPVISTAHGGALETVLDGESGWLVPPKSVSSLKDSILRAIKMPLLDVKKMGEAGRKHVEANFTKTQLQSKTLAVYKSLLAQG